MADHRPHLEVNAKLLSLGKALQQEQTSFLFFGNVIHLGLRNSKLIPTASHWENAANDPKKRTQYGRNVWPRQPRQAQGRAPQGHTGGTGAVGGGTEALTRRAVETALAGDTAALRLCLERITPPRKDAPVIFALPQMETGADAAKAAGAVLASVSDGDLTPIEAVQIMGLIETFRKTLETCELEARVAALEAGAA